MSMFNALENARLDRLFAAAAATAADVAAKPSYSLGEALPQPKYPSHRSMYPIFRNEVLFCFLGMPNGCGKKWEFYPLTWSDRNYSVCTPAGQFGPDTSRHSFDTIRVAGKGRENAFRYLVEGIVQPRELYKDANEMQAAKAKDKANERKVIVTYIERTQASLEAAKRRHIALLGILTAHTTIGSGVKLTSIEVEVLETVVKEAESSVSYLEKQLENGRKKLAEFCAGTRTEITLGDLAVER